MPHTRIWLSALLLLVSALPARAGWFELGVGSDALQVEGGRHFGQNQDGRFALGARGFYNGDEEAREGETLFGGLVARLDAQPEGKRALFFRAGVDLLVGEGADRDIGAAVIGVHGTWGPENWGGLFLRASFGYAGDVTTWGDTMRVLEWGAGGGYQISARLAIFLEYQELEIRFEDVGARTLASAPRIGFGGRF